MNPDEPFLPRVSLVVPIYNAQRTVDACIESLLQLDYPGERFEVLCVDNASADRTAQILQRFATRVRILHEAERGASAARNLGVRAARFEVVAFTDSDCIVAPQWLRLLVAPLRDRRVGIAGGRILATRPANFIERFGESIHNHARAINELKPPYVITMSWASRRAVLEAAGLFDNGLFPGEDVDLAFRIQQQGLHVVYVDEAIVYHHNENTLRGLFGEGYVHGYYAPLVRARHARMLSSPGRWQQARRALRRIAAPQPVATGDPDWRHKLCGLVFNAGKAVGELYCLITRF